MTDPQHKGGWTPGPWRVCDPDIAVNPFIVVDDANMSVADCACFSSSREANARLIAAAPELYEALVEAKKALWLGARDTWTMADFKNWAVVQQIDDVLDKVRAKASPDKSGGA